ncbi:hypothetical protein HMPREF1076_02914 [Parabacteroides goldsteinii CL02T12C30]|uniref:Major fimbrial subunit protein N-terminal domain-containing protein n=1 Tax=Parabacteroides goldsteinii CL02T12C30 TaxID=999418 RepID=K5YK79_9BACT|nr:DUF4906 domain-containing protein [Parabacteroides goldsteinii]EKN14172.1 hypothetical protein HMPREF1076_02914 [Parabacteroides goldsteinii CL02T12C30]
MKKYNVEFLSFLIGCLFFSSCSNEEEVGGDSDKPASISISFEAPEVDQIVTKSVNDYTLIDGIYLFIFDENGDIEGNGPLHYSITSSEASGIIASNVSTTVGNHYIYAIANAEASFAFIEKLDEVRTRGELLNKKAKLGSSLLMTGNLIPMVGIISDSNNGLINITTNGSYEIQLERIISSVKFKVSCTKLNATFDLKSYEVVNVPQTSTLFGENKGSGTDFWPGGTITNDKDNSQSFEFGLFENRYTTTGITTYEDREEKVDHSAVGKDIQFKSAPKYATYVILKGLYKGDSNKGNVSADATYYVHLGNTNNSNYNNFENIRNTEYTYKISIEGVNRLIVEVEDSSKPYDRGDGTISLTAGTFDVDAHYEFFNITIPKGDEYVRENNEELPDWISFRIFDSSDISNITQALTPGEEGKWAPVMKYKTSDGTYNSKLITTMKQLNEELKSHFDDTRSEEVTLTCYVAENMSDNFRECIIFRSKSSGNGSTLLKDGIKIRQNYGRKFFDNNGGYMLEVLNETGTLTDYGIAATTNKNNSSDDDGLRNMKAEVGINATWPAIDQMKKIYAACMARNRDENGNGIIDDNEMKWYLPAINQYIGMWIGAEPLKEARLYTLESGDMVHFVSNSYKVQTINGQNVESRNVLWGEEGSSIGAMAAAGAVNNSGFQLRCIRNFGNNPNSKFYELNKEEKSITMYLYDNAYRNKQSYGELGRVGGHMAPDNLLYKSFYYSEERGEGTLKISGQTKRADTNSSNCSKEGNGWRLPNQRELSMMRVAGILTNRRLISRTYSTFEIDRAFYFSGGNLALSNDKNINAGSYVRCVRDK